MTRVLPMLCALNQAGCLVPLPLEAERAADGGQFLVITEATTPPFGTQRAMTATTEFDYTVDVLTDSDTVAARLYAQVDGTCCDLDVSDNRKTLLLRDPAMVTEVEPGHFRVAFTKTFPCNLGMPREVIYVIPVVAAGGFVGGPTESLESVGLISKNNYWSVQCP